MSTLHTSRAVQSSGYCSCGVWFDVRSDGSALRITAFHAACYGWYDSSCAVVVYGREEGSGVGKERERGAWRQLADGTLQGKSEGGTRLVLSSPLSVRAGARVGLYLQTTDGEYVCLSAKGKQGAVDASDGALAVLYGRRTDETEPFGEFEGSDCFVPAGAIEYELAVAEAEGAETAPAQQLVSAAELRLMLREATRQILTAKLIVAGAGRNGKSSLLVQFTGGEFNEDEESTRGVKQCQVTVQEQAWGDSPGGAGFTASFEEQAAGAKLQLENRRAAAEEDQQKKRKIPEPGADAGTRADRGAEGDADVLQLRGGGVEEAEAVAKPRFTTTESRPSGQVAHHELVGGPKGSNAYVAAFAPPCITPASRFRLDIWAYVQQYMEHAVTANKKRGRDQIEQKGPLFLSHGPVKVRLDLPEAFAAEVTEDSFQWEGQFSSAQFRVECNTAARKGWHECSAAFWVDGKKVSILYFELEVVNSSPPTSPTSEPEEVQGVRLLMTKTAIVMSCPEMGTLDPVGGPPYDQKVMDKIAEMQRRGLVKMGFDRAGTTTQHPDDADVDWSDPEQISRSNWFYGYQVAAKRCISLESQGFAGVLEIVCIDGGLITQVEAAEMARIIEEATADAAKSGVECRIDLRQMSFFGFLDLYDPPEPSEPEPNEPEPNELERQGLRESSHGKPEPESFPAGSSHGKHESAESSLSQPKPAKSTTAESSHGKPESAESSLSQPGPAKSTTAESSHGKPESAESSAQAQIVQVLSEAPEVAEAFARKVQDIIAEKGEQLTDDAPTMVVCDYAGQRMYYVLLQLMLTEALTIYVVVVTLEHALEEELGVQTDDELPYAMTYAQNLDFWLSSIYARAPGAKIQIVCTKLDLVSAAVREERVAAIEDLCEGQAYENQILPIRCVSNKTGEGIEAVRTVIESEAQPYDETTGVGLHGYGQEVPLGWFKFHSITKELRSKGENRISLMQARAIARECEVTDDATLEAMLSKFRDIGFLLWCDENETARRLVVLDVQWMVDTMTQLLCQRSIKEKKALSRNQRSLWTDAQKRGRFSKDLLPELWPDLSEEERANMISYMEHFGLCSRLPEQACPDVTYLVPSLLPAVEPGVIVWDATDHDKDLALRFIHANGRWEESHGFLPDTFFYRLVAELVRGVQTVGNAFKHLYTDRAVIFGKQRFMVTHDRVQHCLFVKVFDDGAGSPAAVGARLDHLMRSLVKSFGLQYRFEVHCSHTGTEQFWALDALPQDHAMKMLWQPIAEDVPPAADQELTKKSIVLSCPEFGTLDPDGGPNAGTNKYDSPVMMTVTRLQKLSRGAIQMGFDRAGTSTSDERDQEIWDQLNPKTAVYVSDVSERKKLVKRTIWFAGYTAAAKAQMRLACQAFDGTVEIICLKGGLVTDVEQDEMDTIISDGIKDAEKSGVECKIEKKVMGFYSFVQEYGEPYGVTVESLLAQTSSGAVVREHGTPEPQPEVVAEGSSSVTTLVDWLSGFKLQSYADAMAEQGYDDLVFLRDLGEHDIDELVADVKMKKGHAKKFKLEWQKLIAQ